MFLHEQNVFLGKLPTFIDMFFCAKYDIEIFQFADTLLSGKGKRKKRRRNRSKKREKHRQHPQSKIEIIRDRNTNNRDSNTSSCPSTLIKIFSEGSRSGNGSPLYWETGPWSVCSKSCGGGFQYR